MQKVHNHMKDYIKKDDVFKKSENYAEFKNWMESIENTWRENPSDTDLSLITGTSGPYLGAGGNAEASCCKTIDKNGVRHGLHWYVEPGNFIAVHRWKHGVQHGSHLSIYPYQEGGNKYWKNG